MPAIFQRIMSTVLSGLTWMFCLVYIDDIVIYSKTFDEHLIHLERILQRFFDAHFTFNLPKCQFFLKEFDNL